MPIIARALAGLCLLASTGLVAQTVTLPLNPRASFLHTNNDAPTPPLVLDLAAAGVTPGTWLRIGTTGGFRYVNGGQDGFRSLLAVFSGSATLLGTSARHRVVDAIAAGGAYTTAPTYYGAQPTDIAEDFYCSRELRDNGMDVQVPPGATHLFLCVHDSLYNDNVDPNGDFGVVLSLVAPPSLPGTNEHLVLASAVDGTPQATPDSHTATPGQTAFVTMRERFGILDGVIYVLFADAYGTGGAPPNPLPGLWSANLIVLQLGVVSSAAGWEATWSGLVVPGHSGTTVVVQGGALHPGARNGLFETTHAHTFAWQ